MHTKAAGSSLKSMPVGLVQANPTGELGTERNVSNKLVFPHLQAFFNQVTEN